MAYVINQCNQRDLKHLGNVRTYGDCSNCGCEVVQSQYGGDDECPVCGESLDWDKYIDNDSWIASVE